MEAGAIFIIRNEVGRFLLEQRNASSKRSQWGWVFPGGQKEEVDKDIIETVIREVEEEFGLKVERSNVQKIGKVDREFQDGFLTVFLIEMNHPDKLIISESAGAGWFSFEEIEKIDLGYNQKTRIFPILISHLKI